MPTGFSQAGDRFKSKVVRDVDRADAMNRIFLVLADQRVGCHQFTQKSMSAMMVRQVWHSMERLVSA